MAKFIFGDTKLQVKFTATGNILTAETLLMDDCMRDRGTLGRVGRYSIFSGTHPAFYKDESSVFYTRGECRLNDAMTVKCIYGSPDDAKTACKAFQTIVRKINGLA